MRVNEGNPPARDINFAETDGPQRDDMLGQRVAVRDERYDIRVWRLESRVRIDAMLCRADVFSDDTRSFPGDIEELR